MEVIELDNHHHSTFVYHPRVSDIGIDPYEFVEYVNGRKGNYAVTLAQKLCPYKKSDPWYTYNLISERIKSPNRILPTVEVCLSEGHILLFAEKPFKLKCPKTLLEGVEVAEDNACVYQIAHPGFYRESTGIKGLKLLYKNNKRPLVADPWWFRTPLLHQLFSLPAIKFARKHGWVVIGETDGYSLDDLGKMVNELYCENSVEAMLEAMRRGMFKIKNMRLPTWQETVERTQSIVL